MCFAVQCAINDTVDRLSGYVANVYAYILTQQVLLRQKAVTFFLQIGSYFNFSLHSSTP